MTRHDAGLSPRTGIYNEGVRVVREAPRPWSATPCEVCEGSGETENDLKRIVPCWYCKGSGWYEAAL